jgi:hypothetical protein
MRAGAVSTRKLETERAYPPDYVSAETLAYRLDCEVEAIEALMRRGALPRPRMIGGLRRWDFASVRAFVEAQNAPARRLAPNGRPGPEDDPFLAALANEAGKGCGGPP